MKKLIGTKKYFVHKGSWDNDYEWRIQKVTITGIKIDGKNKKYAEFGFHCVGYEYPVELLANTLDAAKNLAYEQIKAEKKRQLVSIKKLTEKDCVK